MTTGAAALNPHLDYRERGNATTLPAFLVAAITAAVYVPALFNNFVDWDDQIMLRDNPLLREVSWHALSQIWTHPTLGLYTPLSYTLWLFAAGVSRAITSHLDPHLFHALNVALHATCAALVFTLLTQLFPRRWPAFFGALLFALHPLQVEPTAWVAGMNNLLAAAFGLGALNFYIRAIDDPSRIQASAHTRPALVAAKGSGEKPSPSPSGGGQGRGRVRSRTASDIQTRPLPNPPSGGEGTRVANHEVFFSNPKRRDRVTFILSALCAVLAMLSKPTAIVLPILAIILHLAFRNVSARTAIVRAIPFAIIAGVFIIIGSFAQPAPGIDRPALWQRPFITGDALAFYIIKLFIPLHLNMDYGRSPAWLITQPSMHINWILPVVALLLAIIFRRHTWVFAGALIFMLAPLPVLGLRPFDFQHFSTVADRYVYLAMLGPAILAAGIVHFHPRLAPVLLAIFLLFIIPSEMQIQVWQNDQTLFTHAIRLNPRSVAANRTLGYLAVQRGDVQIGEAYYNSALNVRPDDPLTHHNYASLFNRRGNELESSDVSAAEGMYRRAIEMDAGAAAPHSNLGRLLESHGDMGGARREYEQALQLDPDLAPALRGMDRLNASMSPLH